MQPLSIQKISKWSTIQNNIKNTIFNKISFTTLHSTVFTPIFISFFGDIGTFIFICSGLYLEYCQIQKKTILTL